MDLVPPLAIVIMARQYPKIFEQFYKRPKYSGTSSGTSSEFVMLEIAIVISTVLFISVIREILSCFLDKGGK